MGENFKQQPQPGERRDNKPRQPDGKHRGGKNAKQGSPSNIGSIQEPEQRKQADRIGCQKGDILGIVESICKDSRGEHKAGQPEERQPTISGELPCQEEKRNATDEKRQEV